MVGFGWMVGWLGGGFGVLGRLGHLDFHNFAQLYIQKCL